MGKVKRTGSAVHDHSDQTQSLKTHEQKNDVKILYGSRSANMAALHDFFESRLQKISSKFSGAASWIRQKFGLSESEVNISRPMDVKKIPLPKALQQGIDEIHVQKHRAVAREVFVQSADLPVRLESDVKESDQKAFDSYVRGCKLDGVEPGSAPCPQNFNDGAVRHAAKFLKDIEERKAYAQKNNNTFWLSVEDQEKLKTAALLLKQQPVEDLKRIDESFGEDLKNRAIAELQSGPVQTTSSHQLASFMAWREWKDDMSKPPAHQELDIDAAMAYGNHLFDQYAGRGKAKDADVAALLNDAASLLSGLDDYKLKLSQVRSTAVRELADAAAEMRNSEKTQVVSVEAEKKVADQPAAQINALIEEYEEIFGANADTTLPISVIRQMVSGARLAASENALEAALTDTDVKPEPRHSSLDEDADDGIPMEDEGDDDRSDWDKLTENFSNALDSAKNTIRPLFEDNPVERPDDSAISRLLSEKSPSEAIRERQTAAAQWADEIRRQTREKIEAEPLWKRRADEPQSSSPLESPEPVFIPVPDNIGPPPPPPPPRKTAPSADRFVEAPTPQRTSPAKAKAFQVPELPIFPNIDAESLQLALFENPDFAVDISTTLERAMQYFDSLSEAGQVDQENQVFALSLAGFWRAAKQNPVLMPGLEKLSGFKVLDKLLDLDAIERNFQ